MPTARGRDGPAKEGCRGSRIGAPSPAPGDQPPKGPETAYLYVRPSRTDSTTPADDVRGPRSVASPGGESRSSPGSGKAGGGSRRRRARPFRGELKLAFRDDGGVRRRWYLANLYGPDSDNPSAGTIPVRHPLAPCPVAGGAVAEAESSGEKAPVAV